MRIAIVGNGPIPGGCAAEIDSSNLVVRFNESPNALDRTGTKTDLLFLANSGKHMVARYHPKPSVLSRLMGRRADWTVPALQHFGKAGKEVSVLPPQFYEDCCEELGIGVKERRRRFPSTGFIGIRYAMVNFPADHSAIRLYGFGWEGWKRHAWDAEREWVKQRLLS
jgi:hypothetical protein